jgi:hypothetical protein
VKIRTLSHSTDAVTLIEVLMASAMIALLGADIIGSINYGLFAMRITRENQRATQVMLERLESIRLYNWDQVTNTGFVPATFTESYDPSAPTNAQGIIYYGTMAVTLPAFSGTIPGYASNMRQFTVTLQWTNAGLVPHTRSFTTYVAQNGMQNYIY